MHPRDIWESWAETLRRLKLDGFAAWLLEAGSPLNILGAQTLYIGQPFVGGKQLEAIARMLEDEGETQAFIRLLKKDGKGLGAEP